MCVCMYDLQLQDPKLFTTIMLIPRNSLSSDTDGYVSI